MAEPQAIDMAAANIPVADDGLEAPIIYVDDIRGVMVSNGVTKLNLVQYRADLGSGEIRAVTVAVMAMPAAMLAAFGNFFLKVSEGAGPQLPSATETVESGEAQPQQ